MSEVSPTDLLKRFVSSSAGVLISDMEKFSNIFLRSFSVKKTLLDKSSLSALLLIRSIIPVKE
jgi:hypothetical protein